MQLNQRHTTLHGMVKKWVFPSRPDFGGYADKTNDYVAILKRGKYQ